MKITVKGIDKLTNKLDRLSDNATYKKALNQSLAAVEASSKEFCPVQTGELRRSITSRTEDDLTGDVFTNLFYGVYVHQGSGLFAVNGDGRKEVPWRYQDEQGNWHTTSGQHPQPFLERGLDANTDNIKGFYADVIKEVLDG